MLIATHTGNETFSGIGSTMIMAYFGKPDGHEQPIHTACKDRHTGCAAIGQPEFYNASSRNANHGQWIIGRYQVPERSYIRVFVKRKHGDDWSYNSFQFILFMREDAAQRRLRINLCDAPEATQTAAYFEGRFDIVDPEMFEALKIKVQDSFRNQFLDIDPDHYRDEIIEREITPLRPPRAEVVTTATGNSVAVIRKDVRRVIRLKK